MHRSASWNRFSEDYFKQFTTYQSQGRYNFLSSSQDDTNLPIYDPVVTLTKKEKARLKFAEKAVHLIPLVVLLCLFILWLFSHPDVAVNGDSLGPKIETLNLDGEIEHHIHGNVLKWASQIQEKLP